MLVILEYRGGADLRPLLDAAARVLAEQPGCSWLRVARSPDDPQRWLVATEWDGPGAMRRGLGAYDVKLALGPLQSAQTPAGGAFEVVAAADPGTELADRPSRRAADADSASLER